MHIPQKSDFIGCIMAGVTLSNVFGHAGLCSFTPFKANLRGYSQPRSRKTAMRFEIALLGCSVAPSESWNGKVRLNIKCLGGKASDSEPFGVT